MTTPVSPAPAVAAANPVIPANLTLLLAQASAAAYAYYNATTQSSSVPPPPSLGPYQFVASFTGMDYLLDSEESYGLIYAAAGDVVGPSVIVAFRGTDSVADFLADAECSYATFKAHSAQKPLPATINVHDGFYGVYTQPCPSVNQSMQQQVFHKLPIAPSMVYITGHSLGGALSQLFTLDMAASMPLVPIKTINFASPQVGDTSWETACEQVGAADKITRVINTCDHVPYYPSNIESIWPYVSIGQEFDTTFDTVNWWDPDLYSNHSLANLTTVLQNGLYQNPQGWAGTFQSVYGDIFGYYPMQSTFPAASQAVMQSLMQARLNKLKEVHALTEPHFVGVHDTMQKIVRGEIV